jgi:hypothetical protein
MKTYIQSAITLIFISVAIYSQSKEFYLGFTGSYPANWNSSSYTYTSNDMDWNWFAELNCNVWQGWNASGSNTEIITKLNQHNLYGYFQPETMIKHGAYGRISLFEAESEYSGRHRYNNHYNIGITVNDTWNGESRRVQYYKAGDPIYSSPVPILSDIDERKEQVVSGIPHQFVTNIKDANLKWYVMPKMRIEQNIALDKTEIPVVKVIVKAYDSTIVDSVSITTKNFRTAGMDTYDGGYLEEYFGASIIESGDKLLTGFKPGAPSGVDYEIQWYGKVDVWIDYIKVMDNTAYDLFNQNDPRIRNEIKKEVDELVNFEGLKGFYTEEIQYSNLRCLKYIQEIVQEASNENPNAVLLCLVNPPTFRFSLSDFEDPYETLRYESFVDGLNLPAFLYAGYLFEGPYFIYEESKLPNTINTFTFHKTHPQNLKDEINSYYGSIRKPVDEYNTYIQGRWGMYKNELVKYGTIARSKNMDLYVNTGIQAFYYDKVEWNREPLMTEINTLYGMALCYGAKGILQYAFESFYEPPTGNFNFGMMDSVTYNASDNWQTVLVGKREYNFYGERKWDGFVELHKKIKKWGPIVANSRNTEGYSLDTQGTAHNYILNVQSIYRNAGGEFAPSNLDSVKYWELGFLYPDYLSANNKSRYFMLVNRRCVPELPEYSGVGDIRQLKIKFNSLQLIGSDQWMLVDVYTGRYITFSKEDQCTDGFVDLGNKINSLGYFNPGECKLFKLAPIKN